MAVVTIRPASTVVSTLTLTGASAHVAVNDDLDTTYIQMPYGQFSEAIFNLGAYTLPANSYLKQVRIRVRYRTIDPFGFAYITYWVTRLITSTGYYGSGDSQSSISGSPAESVGAWQVNAPSGAAWTQTELNTLQVDMYAGYYSGNVQMPRIYEVYVDLDINTSPVGAISTPTNLSTETAATRPSMTFTYSDAEGDAMEGYRVKLFDSGTYSAGGFDPNTSSAIYDTGKVGSLGPATIRPPFDLYNGSTYRWYLWVYQTGGPTGTTGYGVSTAVYSQFLVNVTPPVLPAITAAASTSGGGYVTLTINSGGGTPATSTILVERSQNGGATWAKVRGTPVAPGSTLYDFEVIPNKSVIYRGRSTATNGVASLYSTATTAVTVNDDEWRLRDPIDSSRNILLSVVDDRMVQRKPEDKAFFAPMGRARKVSVTDVIRGEESQFTLEFRTQTDFNAFELLRNSQRTLYLARGWTSEAWYISFDQVLEMTLYNYFPTYRTVTISWIEVDAP